MNQHLRKPRIVQHDQSMRKCTEGPSIPTEDDKTLQSLELNEVAASSQEVDEQVDDAEIQKRKLTDQSPVAQNRNVVLQHSSPKSKMAPRKWERHLGQHQFMLNGKIIYGPNVKNVFFTLFIANFFNLLTTAWFVTEHQYTAWFAALVTSWVIMVWLIIQTAFTDPGIVPRQKPFDLPGRNIAANRHLYKTYWMMSGNGAHLVPMKYCLTCYAYKPPGCSHPGRRPQGAHHPTVHCHQCDSCIEQFDHHCPFLSNCIARNNYRSFFLLLQVSLANIALQVCAHWGLADGRPSAQLKETSLYLSVLRYGASPLLGLIAAPLLVLCGFHWIKVATKGSTTYEALKGRLSVYKVDPRNPAEYYGLCLPMCLKKLTRRLGPCCCSLWSKRYPFEAGRRLFQRMDPVDSEEDEQEVQGKAKKIEYKSMFSEGVARRFDDGDRDGGDGLGEDSYEPIEFIEQDDLPQVQQDKSGSPYSWKNTGTPLKKKLLTRRRTKSNVQSNDHLSGQGGQLPIAKFFSGPNQKDDGSVMAKMRRTQPLKKGNNRVFVSAASSGLDTERFGIGLTTANALLNNTKGGSSSRSYASQSNGCHNFSKNQELQQRKAHKDNELEFSSQESDRVINDTNNSSKKRRVQIAHSIRGNFLDMQSRNALEPAVSSQQTFGAPLGRTKANPNQISPTAASKFLTPLAIKNKYNHNAYAFDAPHVGRGTATNYGKPPRMASTIVNNLGSHISLTGQKNFDELEELPDDQPLQVQQVSDSVTTCQDKNFDDLQEIEESQNNAVPLVAGSPDFECFDIRVLDIDESQSYDPPQQQSNLFLSSPQKFDLIYQHNWLDPCSIEGSTREQRQSYIHIDQSAIHSNQAPGMMVESSGSSPARREKEDFTELGQIEDHGTNAPAEVQNDFQRLQYISSKYTESPNKRAYGSGTPSGDNGD